MIRLSIIFTYKTNQQMKFFFFTGAIFSICLMLQTRLFAQVKVNDTVTTAINPEAVPEVGIAPVSPPSEKDIHLKVDEPAQYNGSLNQFIAQNLNFPDEAIEAGVSGRVTVEFVINEVGQVTDIHTKGRKIGYGLEEEAVRVVRSLRNFSPAKVKGKPVKTKMRLPVVFQLTE